MSLFLPIIIATIICIAIGVIFSVFPLGPDKALCRVLAWTAMICIWLMWLMTYLSQMNPLVAPQINFSTSS